MIEFTWTEFTDCRCVRQVTRQPAVNDLFMLAPALAAQVFSSTTRTGTLLQVSTSRRQRQRRLLRRLCERPA